MNKEGRASRGTAVALESEQRPFLEAPNRRRRWAATTLTLVSLLSAGYYFRAQAQPGKPNTFEVTSVKQNKLDPRVRNHDFGCLGGRFRAHGVYVDRVIIWAWNIQSFQLFGAPAWATSEGSDVYDIDANAAKDLETDSVDDCRLMVRFLDQRL